MAFTESDFLRLLLERIDVRAPKSGVRLGVGDDAAVLEPTDRATVVATDMILDGIDFRLKHCGYERAARKAMAKNLSDLGAMGVVPAAAFVSVALPVGITEPDALLLIQGLVEMADAFDCPIAGGDTKRSPGPLVINVLLLGREGDRPPVLRSGAQPGDLLFVTGALGGSALGKHLDFMPRVDQGLRLNEFHRVHAMIDLSDGIATDLHKLCDASGVGAVLEAERLPLAEAAHEVAAQDGRPALEHALADGEDFELLFAAPPEVETHVLKDPRLGVPVTRVGVVTAERGVRLRTGRKAKPLPPLGFEHRFERRRAK